MRAYIGLAVCMIVLSLSGKAQNYAIYNSYYLNPYLYNPAEASSDFTRVQLNHRLQWHGFEGAPKTITGTFTTQLNDSRAGIGAKFSSYSRGILETKDITLTYVYGIPVGPKKTFYFGLSAGAISNNINLTEAGANDPALLTYGADNIQPAGSFGMLLRTSSGLNLGVSLPQLVTPRYNASSHFENPTVAPSDNIIISTYYKRKVEGKIVNKKKRGMRTKVKTKESIAPLELYALYRYSSIGTSQAEGTVKLNLSESVWLAAHYRQFFGFGASVGFAFNNIMLNYSYEPGNDQQTRFSAGSHEINLGLRFGELKKFKRTPPTLRSTMRSNTSQQHIARFQQSTEDPDHSTAEKEEKKKYYVVIKSFADFTSADAFKLKLTNDKYNANIYYYEKDKKYHVYVFESGKAGDAHDEARNLKLYTKLKDARVLIVNIPKNE